MTLWIVLGSVVAYLVVGGFYSRSMAVESYRRTLKSVNGYADLARDWMMAPMVARAVLWPLALLFDVVGPWLRGWLAGPVRARQERAQQLRDDAKVWRAKQHDGTEAERKMAAELARLCDQMAREADL